MVKMAEQQDDEGGGERATQDQLLFRDQVHEVAGDKEPFTVATIGPPRWPGARKVEYRCDSGGREHHQGDETRMLPNVLVEIGCQCASSAL
jgi:hypothetical protein